MGEGEEKVSYTQDMKKASGFWGSLEQYLGKVIERSPLPRYWRHLGIGLALVVVVSSAVSAKNSVVGATSVEEVVEKAARLGDYDLAQTMFEQIQDSRFKIQVEDLVYPERKVERRIVELEAKLVEYPGNRQIYLELADLYGQLGNREKSDEYREKARILDPNN